MFSLIQKYFPSLSDKQLGQFEQLQGLYEDWNAKINVISRKDIDQLYVRHVLHSLAIAKVQPFNYNSEVLDLGTGGGFPGIPLAIMFPDTKFILADSIGKKITVVQGIIDGVGLTNAQAINTRAEKIDNQFDFVVTRAVAPLPDLKNWVNNKFNPNCYHKVKNGVLALKGGDLREEIRDSKKKCKEWDISTFFEEDFFKEDKKVVHMQMVS